MILAEPLLKSALRAPLPPEPAHTSRIDENSPWHKPNCKSLSARVLWQGERRLEGETYLASGYGLRLALEAQPRGGTTFGDIADVSQPNRTKATLVNPKDGTPFLAATQAFDVRPVPRKWLSLEQLSAPEDLFVSSGTILVTRSGTVGRAILAHATHENILISDDLLRVKAREAEQRGWIYAFLRSPQARAMMSSAQYGHIIKHLEVAHLNALPIPEVSAELAQHCNAQVAAILQARNEGHRLTVEAERRFEAAILPLDSVESETGFSVSSSALSKKRRRFEALYFSPIARAILTRFETLSLPTDALASLTNGIYSMGREKKYFGPEGMPYLSAYELFAVNSSAEKRILVSSEDGYEAHFVQPNWLVMACSGQIYGLNGSAMLITEDHQNIFFSQDLIRIVPDESQARSGYLLTALTHPQLGRPLLIRAAYGTSIPHLDPNDVAAFPVVRLGEDTENAIADLAEAAARERSRADILERELAREAGELIDRFIEGQALI